MDSSYCYFWGKPMDVSGSEYEFWVRMGTDGYGYGYGYEYGYGWVRMDIWTAQLMRASEREGEWLFFCRLCFPKHRYQSICSNNRIWQQQYLLFRPQEIQDRIKDMMWKAWYNKQYEKWLKNYEAMLSINIFFQQKCQQQYLHFRLVHELPARPENQQKFGGKKLISENMILATCWQNVLR